MKSEWSLGSTPSIPFFDHAVLAKHVFIFIYIMAKVAVAVGMPIARCPPHGSVRALISGRVRQWRGPGFE